ncbi:MAG: Crp/Fnr family transcriptional regulator [Saprospiraceae bacterium]
MPIDKATILKTALDKQAILQEEEWTEMRSYLKERTFKKGQFLCRNGQVEHYLSIIVEGTCRGFYTNKEGEEISVAFIFPNDYVSAYYSFLTQRPSLMAVQAVTAVTIISISHTHLNLLCDKYKNAERIGRLNAERVYRRKEEREIALLTMSATERYQDLINRSPQLLQQISLKHIASYLGIKPESLSRIRKQLANQ